MKNFKRIFAAILVVAVVVTSVFITSAAEFTESSDNSISIGKLGDADGSNAVTIKDVTCIQKYIAGIVPFTENRKILADVNGDDAITIKDVTAIQKWLCGYTITERVNSPFYRKAFLVGIRTADAYTGNTVVGVTYGIYANKNCTELLEEVTATPSSGSAYTKTKYCTGTYYVRQLEPAANYQLDDTVYEVSVSEETATSGYIWLVVWNKQSPKRLDIKTYDADNYHPAYPLKGSVYGIYSDEACTEQIGTLADMYSDAIYEVGETYYIKQLIAADGYAVNETIHKVTIPNDQYLVMVSVTIFNTKFGG